MTPYAKIVPCNITFTPDEFGIVPSFAVLPVYNEFLMNFFALKLNKILKRATKDIQTVDFIIQGPVVQKVINLIQG